MCFNRAHTIACHDIFTQKEFSLAFMDTHRTAWYRSAHVFVSTRFIDCWKIFKQIAFRREFLDILLRLGIDWSVFQRLNWAAYKDTMGVKADHPDDVRHRVEVLDDRNERSIMLTGTNGFPECTAVRTVLTLTASFTCDIQHKQQSMKSQQWWNFLCKNIN